MYVGTYIYIYIRIDSRDAESDDLHQVQFNAVYRTELVRASVLYQPIGTTVNTKLIVAYCEDTRSFLHTT